MPVPRSSNSAASSDQHMWANRLCTVVPERLRDEHDLGEPIARPLPPLRAQLIASGLLTPSDDLSDGPTAGRLLSAGVESAESVAAPGTTDV